MPSTSIFAADFLVTSCAADPRCRADFPPDSSEVDAVPQEERGTIPSWKMLAVTYVSSLVLHCQAGAEPSLRDEVGRETAKPYKDRYGIRQPPWGRLRFQSSGQSVDDIVRAQILLAGFPLLTMGASFKAFSLSQSHLYPNVAGKGLYAN